MKTFMLKPGGKYEEEIFQLIEEKGIFSDECRLCMAYFSHDRIADFIKQRFQAGLSTLVLLNARDIFRPFDGRGKDLTLYLQKALLQVFQLVQDYGEDVLKIRMLGDDEGGLTMHHKFVVLDDLVGFGSLNFTYAGFRNNYENFSFSSDEDLIRLFGAEFNQMWIEATSLNIMDGKLRNLVCPYCNGAEGIDFESYGLVCTLCGREFRAPKSPY